MASQPLTVTSSTPFMVLGISGPVKRSPKASLAFESALDPSSVEVIEEGLVGEYWSQLSHPGDEDIHDNKKNRQSRI